MAGYSIDLAAISLDDAWTAKGAANIKNNVKTYYKPNAAEQAKWNEGAVQAWKGAKAGRPRADGGSKHDGENEKR